MEDLTEAQYDVLLSDVERGISLEEVIRDNAVRLHEITLRLDDSLVATAVRMYLEGRSPNYIIEFALR